MSRTNSPIGSEPVQAQASAQGDGVLAVQGVLNFDTVPAVLAQSAAWMQQAHNTVTIDLKGVERADSAGLALLVEWLHLAHNKGQELKFVNVPEQVRSLIRVNGLGRALRFDSQG